IFFSSRRRHTRFSREWSSDVCSSDLFIVQAVRQVPAKLAAFREGLNAQQRATLIFALWPGVILLFFSFSSRQEYYVLPGLPGARSEERRVGKACCDVV